MVRGGCSIRRNQCYGVYNSSKTGASSWRTASRSSKNAHAKELPLRIPTAFLASPNEVSESVNLEECMRLLSLLLLRGERTIMLKAHELAQCLAHSLSTHLGRYMHSCQNYGPILRSQATSKARQQHVGRHAFEREMPPQQSHGNFPGLLAADEQVQAGVGAQA